MMKKSLIIIKKNGLLLDKYYSNSSDIKIKPSDSDNGILSYFSSPKKEKIKKKIKMKL